MFSEEELDQIIPALEAGPIKKLLDSTETFSEKMSVEGTGIVSAVVDMLTPPDTKDGEPDEDVLLN